MNPQNFQWPGQGSVGSQDWLENYSPTMPGGHAMATTGRNNSNVSNNTTSSISTHHSWGSPSTPLSYSSGSPTECGAVYSPYHSPLQNDSEPFQDYFQASSAKYSPGSTRATPLSLGWTLPSQLTGLYKFIVKQNGKERFFELLPECKITRETPQRVDLDQDPNPIKGYHRCMFPGGCRGKQNTFNRPADLDRHYQNFHADEDMKKKFYCDFVKCARAADPFTRKDHYRDHLRDFHQEDLGCAKGANSKTKKSKQVWEAEQAKWLLERKIFPHYWRCSRCLDRISVAKHGWDCARCGTTCETDRISARTITAKAELVETMDLDMEYNPSLASYSSCITCTGNGVINGGYGDWISCPSCQPCEQEFYTDNSYRINNNSNNNNGTWQ